jgi:ferredoxin
MTDAADLGALAANIKALAGASTADLVGVAPGEAFSMDELGDLGTAFGPVAAVVVLAQRITDPVQLARYRPGENHFHSRISTSFADAMLKDAAWRVVHMLREAGYKAAIPRNLGYRDSDPAHRIHFKKAAVLAGFGAFGRNQLVIHPEWGPWLMLRTVITDAPLPADARSEFSPCEGCGICIQVCPSGALSETGIDREICGRTCGYGGSPNSRVVRLSAHGQINCEECLRACPVGEAPPRMG